MKRLFRELRRREVFRTAGLYVGVCWILIEVCSVLLPTFGAPEWILRGIIIATMVGFPVMLVLAWIYDLTEGGIQVQADAPDTAVAPVASRRMDFVVIGVLSVALILSVYMNVTSGPAVEVALDPISVLIADFENGTGQSLFEGLVEQALNIGIESAPHVTSYQRNGAKELASQIQPDSAGLDVAMASLVAVRQGIKMVLSGSILSDDDGYRLQVEGVDPLDGKTLFTVGKDADSADAVLQVIGDLSKSVREELGDTTLDSSDSAIAETFTASSIEAARAYMNGLQLAYNGDHEAAVEAYQEAISLDQNFGRAYAAVALSLSRLGNLAASEEAWEKAFETMGSMTERERLRTQGVYYASVTKNYQSAIDAFSSLVKKFPADAAGYNNLAVVHFLTLDFESARTVGGRLLDIYPASLLYRSNYALYALYATDFGAALAESQNVVEQDATFYKGWLPQAIVALDNDDFDAAMSAYELMAQAGTRGASLAGTGLADIEMLRGDFQRSIEIATAGMSVDLNNDNTLGASTKQMLISQALLESGETSAAADAARAALALTENDSVAVAAALVFVASGDDAAAREIAARLGEQLQPQRRSYSQLIEASIDLRDGRTVDAVDKLTAALERADLWLIRFALGKAYLQAGYAAEALAEFEGLHSRRGEATAIFLDDIPSARFLAELPYWIGRAQMETGMQDAGRQSLQKYLDHRSEGGRHVDDARSRL